MVDLKGIRFLDAGCGSGLFSLVASRLGASVYSFDFDSQSVRCATELRARSRPGQEWEISRGSVLDTEFLKSLGRFDVVYSWGVLHHTGDMWQAMENMVDLVRPGGKLFISIYNDQGVLSQRWVRIKKAYVSLPRYAQILLTASILLKRELRNGIHHALHLRNPLPFKRWSEYKKNRGMSIWYDYEDWVGGYPFQVAKPDEVFAFYHERNFTLEYLRTSWGGCNEFVFSRGK